MKHSAVSPTANWQRAGFGLYVHWPFCQSKCPYCDFNSHVSSTVNHDQWLQAFRSEIQRLAKETPGRVLRSIFFGGGTPSLMAPTVVEGIITEAAAVWSLANDIEITLEANPTSAEARKFLEFRSAGVNRISVGLQAMNNPDLRRLGRMHTAEEGIRAVRMAQDCFDRTSFDLIYARQDQSLAAWEGELQAALVLAGEHLSLYQLTVEDGTVFGARNAAGHLKGLPNEDLSVDMFELTQDMCQAAGLSAYEVSNHAVLGAESRHNMIYWRGGDYLGIGPGAHGRLYREDGLRYATTCPKQPNEWLALIRSQGNGELPREILPNSEKLTEALIMGMRLRNGIDLAETFQDHGVNLDQSVINRLQQSGHVEVDEGRLRATRSGILILNAVIEALLP